MARRASVCRRFEPDPFMVVAEVRAFRPCPEISNPTEHKEVTATFRTIDTVL